MALLTFSACAAPSTVQPTVSAPQQPTATDEPTTPEATETPVEEASAPAAESAVITSTGETSTTAAESEVITATDETTTTAAAAPVTLQFNVGGEYHGIPVGFTSEGNPFRGSPDAPVTMFEYSDFQCPFCVRYFVQTEPAINESYVRDGRLNVVFMDFPLVQLHPNAPAAHAASLCIADQGIELYWNMHDQIFRSQSEWSNSLDPALVFERLAGEVGGDVDAFKECVASAVKNPIVDGRVAAAAALGFSGTPSFRFVNNASGESFDLVGAQPFDQFAVTIDAMVAGETPASAQQEQQQGSDEIPFWATAEGLALDPDRPGYTVAGDQTRGDPNALLTVVEFSDFQCPYCKRHSLESQPALDEKYVDSGKVRWVFKHFPLNIHPQAPAAGVAAECASEQDMFWEMHELLFERSADWSISDPNPVFLGLAGELGLDADAFQACLADPEMQARVDSDLQEGGPYVRGTPTFVVLAGQGGQIIPGALPLERFEEFFDQILAEVGGS
jgi:protein-disulfide isomerase